ncbi:MAG: hypothetical protein DIU69_13110 [Bacillota bacterium]|nr:MAG: hypothetical protein DIU69_13110 [Bacillota bacterium]
MVPVLKLLNPSTNLHEPLCGRNGAMRVELYDASGNPLTVDCMYETQSGNLVTTVPAGSTIVVTQVNQACDLESLSMGTDYNLMALRVENRRADGTYEQGMRLVGPSGQWTNPVRPKDLHDLGGENDFWREFVYDDTNKKFALGMKRQSKFGAGIRIRLYNQDTVDHNAAVTWMISVFRR